MEEKDKNCRQHYGGLSKSPEFGLFFVGLYKFTRAGYLFNILKLQTDNCLTGLSLIVLSKLSVSTASLNSSGTMYQLAEVPDNLLAQMKGCH